MLNNCAAPLIGLAAAFREPGPVRLWAYAAFRQNNSAGIFCETCPAASRKWANEFIFTKGG